MLLWYLWNVFFNGIIGLVKFDVNGDSVGKYDFYVFRNFYSVYYMKLGSWVEGKLMMDFYVFYRVNNYFELYCGKFCGFYVIRCICDMVCCWICEDCDVDFYVENDFMCKICDKGIRLNVMFDGCEFLYEVYFNKVWIVVVGVFVFLGIFVIVIVCVVFFKFV